MAIPNGQMESTTELGPNPFEDRWNENRQAGMAPPSGEDAAAASDDLGEQGHEPTDGQIDDSFLTYEERSALDPSDPTYQTLMRAFARRQGGQATNPAEAEAFENFRLQQMLQSGQPGGAESPQNPMEAETGLWDGMNFQGETPEELKEYEPWIVSRIKDVATHVVTTLEKRARVQEAQAEQHALKTRITDDAKGILSGPMSGQFKADLQGIMLAAKSRVGQTMLLDPSVGMKGLWNYVRAQQGKAPLQWNGQARAETQGRRPQTPDERRLHQVERTVPSVQPGSSAASQLPPPRSTREAVEQAFRETIAEHQARGRRP